MPERLARGPVGKRRLTDKICLFICLIFFIFFIVMIFTYSWNNDYKALEHPMDSEARICGRDEAVKDFPYLYVFKFERNYRSVCVRECLKFDYNQIKYNADGNNGTYSMKPMYFGEFNERTERKWFKGSQEVSNKNSNFDYDPDFAAGYFTKEQFDTYRQRLQLQCAPNNDVKSCNQNPGDGIHYYDSRPYTLNTCFPLSPKVLRNMDFLGDLSAGIVSDLKAAKWMIFLAMIMALVFGIAFLLLSSFMIEYLIWILIVLFVLLCLFLGVMCWIIAFHDYTNHLKERNYKPSVVKQFNTWHNSKWWMCITGTILILIGLGTAFMAFLSAKAIKQSAIILKFSAGYILKHMHLVLVGIVCFVIQILFFFFALWIFLGLYTSGELIRDSEAGEPIPQYRIGFWRWVLVIPFIIATYWIFCTINNIADFITSATVINSYFGRPKGFMLAVKDTFVYHLGSVCLASFILAPISLLQLVFGWLFDLMTATGLEGEANFAQKIAGKVCCCILWPYKKFILRMNEAGFGMVYMASADYCVSSKETYYLFLSYANKTGKLDLIGTIYKMIVVLTVALLNSWLFYWIFTYFDYYVENINNAFVPTLFIFIMTALIVIIFMNIYTTVTQAALLCYLIELDTGAEPRLVKLRELIQKGEKVHAKKGSNVYEPLN